jgi:superfamily II DNA or RNA helicase
MAKILIKGHNSQIAEESDVEHILALDKHLSFFVLGAEHTAAYRGFFNKSGDFVRWDGRKKLLTPSLTFPTGLVERVRDFYQNAGRSLEVIDQRPAKSVGNPKDILPRLRKMGKEPYPYQMDVISVIEKNDRGIIKMATGAGKSVVAALVTAHLGKKTVIYVIGKDLLHQFHALFSSIFEEKIGIIGDGLCEIHDINVASIWTVGQALGMDKKNILLDGDDDEEKLSAGKYVDIVKMIKEAKVQIIDECHMSACETIQQIFKKTSAEHIYGLSGSPWRDDGADLLIESILGRYIINISASSLIEGGYLAQPLIRFRIVPPPTQPLDKNYPSVYKRYITENTVRNNLILEAAQILVGKGYQALVLFSSLKHGRLLYKLFSQHMECVILDGSNSKEERDLVKERLASGEVKCVLASRIFDVGVDLPSLSGLVVASGGKSTVRALQRVGRIIRKYPGKKQAVVIDFVDQAPFLLEHSKARYRIYTSEEGFNVTWPGKKPRKKKQPAAN